MFDKIIESTNQEVFFPLLEEKEIRLFIKREDTIHPFVSGNKFRKLKYNIQEASLKGKSKILTFGGAYSNHIVATAVAGNLSGFKTIGVIRGDELGFNLKKVLEENDTLRKANENGMEFCFVSRQDYRNKETESFIDYLKNKFGDFYLIPEGGTNDLAIKGCSEILSEKDKNFNYICVSVGTGGTISGLIKSVINTEQQIIGFPALKEGFLLNEIKKTTINQKNWCLQKDYHFGGYAKYNKELIIFINEFKKNTSILLDPIYTGKMLFGVFDLIKKNYYPPYSNILAIHTGGLQGVAGINKKLQKRNLELIKI